MEECSLFLENKASVEREIVFDAGGGFFSLMKVMKWRGLSVYANSIKSESERIGSRL